MTDIGDKWNKHLRVASRPRIPCPLCSVQIDRTAWRTHVEAAHSEKLAGLATDLRIEWYNRFEQAIKDAIKVFENTAKTLSSEKSGRKADASALASKAEAGGSASAADDKDYDRRPLPKGCLWTADRAGTGSGGPPTNTPTKQSRSSPAAQTPQQSSSHASAPVLLMQVQPATRPISQDQLVLEVKAIYAGLVMVESKCIEVDNLQTSRKGDAPKLNNEQWQALISLHRTLLQEHHDFFLASQHPTATQALRRLPAKYSMPARMWRHGIHSFLEVLRHRLPASIEHMLSFIYLAYSMITLLYETVPAFKDTWIECLGDLGRYRMAIEDADMKDREVWTAVSRDWYTMASDNSPTVGRLYHHLAILARPNVVQQLYLYAKSVCVPTPFASTRDSALTLFGPHLSPTGANLHCTCCDGALIRCHGVIFCGGTQYEDQYPQSEAEFTDSLDEQIDKMAGKWTEQGYYTGIANSCSLNNYGGEDNLIAQIIRSRARGDPDKAVLEGWMEPPNAALEKAISLNRATNLVVLRRTTDPGVLAYLHVVLCFFHYLSPTAELLKLVQEAMPWKALAHMLNTFASTETQSRHESSHFPLPEKGSASPFPEDWALRGLSWAGFFPKDWFLNDRSKIDDSERLFERSSLLGERKERILWLATRMAETGNGWLMYNKGTRRFAVHEGYMHKNEVDGDDED